MLLKVVRHNGNTKSMKSPHFLDINTVFPGVRISWTVKYSPHLSWDCINFPCKTGVKNPYHFVESEFHIERVYINGHISVQITLKSQKFNATVCFQHKSILTKFWVSQSNETFF